MFLLFLTSIQFWYRPDYGIRRNIDMTLCKVLGFYYYLTILYDRDEYYSMVFLFGLTQICFLYIGEMILVAMYNPKWIVLHMAMHFQMALFLPFILYILWMSPENSKAMNDSREFKGYECLQYLRQRKNSLVRLVPQDTLDLERFSLRRSRAIVINSSNVSRCFFKLDS